MTDYQDHCNVDLETISAESVINSLNELNDSIETVLEIRNMSYEKVEKFKKTSALLVSLLPSCKLDPSIFDIDDLLYPGQVESLTKSSSNRSEESIKFLVQNCFGSFKRIFYHVDLDEKYYILDTAYVRILEHLSDEDLENDDQFSILEWVFELLNRGNRNAVFICRIIKILKVVIEKHMKFVDKCFGECIICYRLFLILSKIKSLPEAKHPQTKRLTSWLSHQCMVILERLNIKPVDRDLEKFVKANEKLQNAKVFDRSYIRLLHKKVGFFPDAEYLFKYFQSVQNEEESLQRSKHFIMGIAKEDEDEETEYGVATLREMYRLINFSDVSKILLKFDNQEGIMNLIDEQHCNDLEPYIPEHKIGELMEADYDYTLEKFLVYDDFLKCLYVLSKIYDIVKNCKNYVKIKGDIEGIEGELFRGTHLSGITLLNERLMGYSTGPLPWWFHTMWKKCPFLFLGEQNEYLTEDVLRMLRGEKIDDTIRTEQNYLLNFKAVPGCTAIPSQLARVARTSRGTLSFSFGECRKTRNLWQTYKMAEALIGLKEYMPHLVEHMTCFWICLLCDTLRLSDSQ